MSPNLDRTLGDPIVSRMMKRRLFTASVFCLIVAFPNLASAASAGVPAVDIGTTCRDSDKPSLVSLGPVLSRRLITA
jgi:hypothetical protein